MQYVVQAIVYVCYAFIAVLVVRSVMSWFPIDPSNTFLYAIVNFLHTITEPILAPLRRILPRLEMIDLAPMVAIILLYIIIWALQRAI